MVSQVRGSDRCRGTPPLLASVLCAAAVGCVPDHAGSTPQQSLPQVTLPEAATLDARVAWRYEGGEPLYRVLAAAFVGGLGEYVIVQNRASLLRLSDTTVVATAGGTGQGPTEFSSIRNLVVSGDSLWATNAAPPKVVAFRATDLAPLNLMERLPSTPVTIARGEHWVATTRGRRILPSSTARSETVDPVLRIENGSADTLALLPGKAMWGHFNAYLPIPFQSIRTGAALPDGYVHWDESASAMVVVRGMGHEKRTLGVVAGRERVTKAAFERWRRSILGDIPLASANEVFRTMPKPEQAPLYRRTRIGPNVIWAQRYPRGLDFDSEPDVVWDLYALDLTYHGAVSLPSRFTPLAVTSARALGILRDHLDVAVLVEYEVLS